MSVPLPGSCPVRQAPLPFTRFLGLETQKPSLIPRLLTTSTWSICQSASSAFQNRPGIQPFVTISIWTGRVRAALVFPGSSPGCSLFLLRCAERLESSFSPGSSLRPVLSEGSERAAYSGLRGPALPAPCLPLRLLARLLCRSLTTPVCPSFQRYQVIPASGTLLFTAPAA